MHGQLKSIIYHASPWPARLRKLSAAAEKVLRQRGVPCRVRAYRVVDAESPGVSPLLLVLSEVVDEPGTELDHEAVRRALIHGLNREVGTALRRGDLLISVDSIVPASAAGADAGEANAVAAASPIGVATVPIQTAPPQRPNHGAAEAPESAVFVREFPPEAWRQFKPTDTSALTKH